MSWNLRHGKVSILALAIAMGAGAETSRPASKTAGFKFVSVESGSVYERLGLKTGDVLISINGEYVFNFSQVKTILGDLKPGHYKLEVLRGRRHLFINYDVK